MKEYVMTFIFNEDLTKVALIKKNRPAFLAGGYNGIGGKVEDHEFPTEAAIREFHEEAGVKFPDWGFLAHSSTYEGCSKNGAVKYKILGFVGRASNVDFRKIKTQTDENVVIFEYDYALRHCNVLPLAKVMMQESFDFLQSKG